MDESVAGLPTGRTLSIHSDEIKRLRIERGWDAATLASRAGCSEKTIRNVESGARIYLATLVKIARTLKVDFKGLLADARNEEAAFAETPQSGRRITIQATFAVSFGGFDETSDLPDIQLNIERAIAALTQIGIITVRPGSVTIALDVSEYDAVTFVAAFCLGKLDALAMSRLMIEVDPGIWELLRQEFVEGHEDDPRLLDRMLDWADTAAEILASNRGAAVPPREELIARVTFTARLLNEINLQREEDFEFTIDATGLLTLT